MFVINFSRVALSETEAHKKVRAEHHRKTGFIPGFECLVAGCAASQEPSFLGMRQGALEQSTGEGVPRDGAEHEM